MFLITNVSYFVYKEPCNTSGRFMYMYLELRQEISRQNDTCRFKVISVCEQFTTDACGWARHVHTPVDTEATQTPPENWNKVQAGI